jgi:hypothetical protein
MTERKVSEDNNESLNPSLFNLEKLIAESKNIPLSISGLDSEKQKANLESQIQEIIRTELAKYVQSMKANDSKDNPPVMTGAITVSFENLPVPLEIRQKLESRVHEAITEIVPKEEDVGKQVVCVYTPIYPGGRLVRNFPLQYEKWFFWYPSGEDMLWVWISSHFHAKTYVDVNLRLYTNMWAKELSSWHYHPNIQRVNTIRVERPGPNSIWMRLNQPDCNSGAHTLILRKPKFLGTWWDMYYFDTVEFWSSFGGRNINFMWLRDWD